MNSPRLTRIALGLAGLLAAGSALATSASTEPQRWQLNLHEGVTQTSHNAYSGHMLMLWICVAIGILVFGAMGYAMFKFRKSKGAVPDTNFTHSTLLEAIWTIVPIVILVVSSIPATRLVMAQYGADNDPTPAEMTVKVTGYQWMWRYEYIGEDVAYISRLDRKSDLVRQDRAATQEDIAGVEHYLRNVDCPLVLPAETRIRFVITADDVIHAWWVPSLGWKQDAIPGIINDNWTKIDEPGTYRGQCAELCGKDHGFMPIVVNVLPKADYAAWLAESKTGNKAACANIMAAAAPEAPAVVAPAAAEPAPADAEVPAPAPVPSAG